MTTRNMMILAAYLHAVGVSAYLGGALVMEFVLGPAQKAIPPAQAQVMGQKSNVTLLTTKQRAASGDVPSTGM